MHTLIYHSCSKLVRAATLVDQLRYTINVSHAHCTTIATMLLYTSTCSAGVKCYFMHTSMRISLTLNHHVIYHWHTLALIHVLCMQILPKEDADAGQIVLESMLNDGVVFVFNCKFIRIEHAPPTGDQVLPPPHACRHC